MPTDQIIKMLRTLSVRQRWTIGLIVVMLGAGLYATSVWSRESGFKPLYNGLSSEDAAMVLQKLKETGIQFRLTNNGSTIAVPEDRVAELRLEMAGAGLPKNGRIGFELFDKTNFGITEFAEHVNYRRALEGELERSVISVAEIEQARVHISLPQESVFLEARQPAKASVLVKIRQGASIPETAIPAITNLIASAVEGLSPDNVSVLDMRGNLLNRPKRTGAAAADDSSNTALEYRHKVEQDLVAKLDSTLEPVVGAGRFRTAVSADCDLTSGEQSEETFDPNRSVMVSSQKTEDTSTQSHAPVGVPGTASTLPNPAAAQSSGNTTSRKTESINYQTSRTMKRTILPQGAIRRLSVSVLLDQDVRWENNKRVVTPPSEERMKAIRELATAAAGLNTSRGDQLIVESLPFEATLNMDPPLTPTGAPETSRKLTPQEQIKKNPKVFIGVGTGALLVLAAVGFGIFKMRGSKPGAQTVRVTDALPAGMDSYSMGSSGATGMGQVDAGASMPALGPARVEVLTTQLRTSAQKNAEICAGVLRGWLREDGV
jgi:flagellar M-ring protein FliF